MNDTALMIRLLGRLKKEMNGAVAEAMQRRGLNYPLNYGVSVPTIRSIAGEYGTSHSLAMLLYRQQVRELKLAAAFVDDPQQVTPDQMRLWADGFANTELVEQVVYNLFRKAPGAERVALEWLDSPKPLLRYAGLLTAASTVRPEMEQTMRQAFFDRIDQLVFREIDSSAVLRDGLTAVGPYRPVDAPNGGRPDRRLRSGCGKFAATGRRRTPVAVGIPRSGRVNYLKSIISTSLYFFLSNVN